MTAGRNQNANNQQPSVNSDSRLPNPKIQNSHNPS